MLIRISISLLTMFAVLMSCRADEPTSSTKLQIPSGDDRAGYMQFLDKASLKPYRDKLPKVESSEYQAFLHNPDTMWYNDNKGIMETVYQDSVKTVLGLRHNKVGHQVGTRHKNDPQISKLKDYFHEEGFRFPFFRTAGTDDVKDFKLHTLWLPPKKNGKVLPVLWWNDRDRFRWTFPVETYFAELIYVKDPDISGEWLPYEIRVRKRYIEGWAVDVFRPFPTAESLASAVEKLRPNWKNSSELKNLVDHLRDSKTLESKQRKSSAYGAIFEAIDGSIDSIPAISDHSLIRELLKTTKFKSAKGHVWKRDGAREAYAASTQAEFSIVPRDYDAGLFPVNEESCNRCHQDTGRYVGEFDPDVQLYGEIWGDDWIFSWHPFTTVGVRIDSTFENNRIINPRMVKSGLLKKSQPPKNSDVYKPMRRRFTKIFR